MAGTVFQNDFLKLIYQAAAIADLAENDTSSPLTNLYVALHHASPTDAGDQTSHEVAYTTYARVAVARSAAGWTVTDNAVTNAAAVVFPACTALTTHFSVGTAASGAGKLLHYGPLTANLAISAGITPSFAIGKLSVTVATV
jgi:hypothetical protein